MDHRDTAHRRHRDKLMVIEATAEGDYEVELPTKYDVCPTCGGRGSYVNPSIDAHGITADEWEKDWDDEEREGYFRGDYNVPCGECRGLRVVLVPDDEHCDKDLLRLWYEQQRDIADMYAMEDAERRMGA